MVKPIETPTREIKNLDGLWRFLPDTGDVAEPWKAVLPGSLECPVPASYNDIFVPSLREHLGKVWYQRDVRIPRGWSDQRIFIRFDSATHAGEVYIDDTLVVKHIGGYLPFEADLTQKVKPGQQVRITVGVDNTLTNETIPPGQLLTNQYGKKQQKYWHDFFNFAGLHRSVRLFTKPLIAVEDVTVTTDLDGSTGVVNYNVKIAGDARVEVDLLDVDQSAGSSSGAKGSIRVKDAKLWQPGAAYLYTLRVRLYNNSTLDDEYTLPVGIRTVRVEGTQILINNKPFYFTGFGKHEDAPVKGKGHDDAWMVHDFELMKWTGANSFRTSHYPYAEDVLDYADRHGWVVIDETPAVGLNLNIGGGIFGLDFKPTFSEDFANSRTQAAHKQVLRELVQRDKNHPSVVLWCITNEPGSNEDGAREYFEPLVKLTRELDPTRPITYTNLQMVPPETDRIADLFDVIGLNRYFGWYEFVGDFHSAEKKLEAELLEWERRFKRPLLMLEYGTDTVAGLHSTGETPWSEEYQSGFYDLYHRVFDRVEALRGEQVWNFADFATGPGIFRVDGNKKGVFTRDRKPKLAAHTLRKRWLKQ
ncbi:beta-glucuronidase [Papiliotrema laurentii]|uniref:Beta-glucuronidase n=1 Tax=Papiliotrema laurentii TaxID=5418 RepID=A0AAD9CXH6_PAPLA|nr:beta-glucuronidase [Papiliotrema laurentii]